MVAERLCQAGPLRNLRWPVVLFLALSVGSCALPGYYDQAINGELRQLLRLPAGERSAALQRLMTKSADEVRN